MLDGLANQIHVQVAQFSLEGVRAAGWMRHVVDVQFCKSGGGVLEHGTEQIGITLQGKARNQDALGINRFRSLSQYPEKGI